MSQNNSQDSDDADKDEGGIVNDFLDSTKYDLKQIGRCNFKDATKSILFGCVIFINIFLLIAIIYSPVAWLLSLVPVTWKEILWGVPFGMIDGLFAPGYAVVGLFDHDALPLSTLPAAYVCVFGLFCLSYLSVGILPVQNIIYALARSSNRYKNEKNIKPLSNDTLSRIRESRVVKIFISSTFANLKDERDYLMQEVFPRINRETKKRGISIVPVDLRWGIPPEEAYSENVIVQCLKAIDECSPFIIGISSARYGWVPESYNFSDNSVLYNNFPWIKKEIENGKSITEIEMAYGALNKASDVKGAFFFKSRSFGDVWLSGIDDAASMSKSAMLRRRILDNPRVKAYTFGNTKTLGRKIEEYIKTLIDEIFTDETDTDNACLDHETKATVQLITSDIYIARPEIESQIYKFLKGDCKFMIISGQPGIGKTSATLKVLDEYKRRYNSSYAYSLFGNDYYNKMWQDAMKKINGLLDDVSIIVWDINKLISDENLNKVLEILKRIDRFKFILLFDEQAGKPHDYIDIEDAVSVKIQDMRKAQRMAFVSSYLERSNKHIKPQGINDLCELPFAGNPLTLKTVIDILISFGNIENFDELFAQIKSLQTPDDVFAMLTEFYRKKYGEEYVNATLAYLHNHGSCTLDYKAINKEIEDDYGVIAFENEITHFIQAFPGFDISDNKLSFSNRYIADYAHKIYTSFHPQSSY